MSAPVFLAEPGSLSLLEVGAAYPLAGDEGRHAGVVQRRGPGERVDVVDGAGVRLVGTVEAATGDGVLVRVTAVIAEPAPHVRLVLVQALAKGDRDELAIEAATEIGVDAVLPWQADRSIVVWRADRAAKSRARWQGTVKAATKQARRARLPLVEESVDSRGLTARTRAVVAAGGAVLVLHEEAVAPLWHVELPPGVEQLGPGDQSGGNRPEGGIEVLVVVGPEGGISDRELDSLGAAGAVAVRLGPHILRTSTAGPVALTLLSTRLRRW